MTIASHDFHGKERCHHGAPTKPKRLAAATIKTMDPER